MIRTAAAVIVLHGVIHLIGFVAPWQIISIDGFAYRTTVFGGLQDIGDAGVRAIGLVWLGLAFGFLAAGYAVWTGNSRAAGATGLLAGASLVVCVAGLPETAAGVAMNVAIMAVMITIAIAKSRRAMSVADAAPDVVGRSRGTGWRARIRT